MAQFKLTWYNGLVLLNTNSTGQRALYRQKSVGGDWISTGFTPANDLPKTAQTVDSPSLDANKVWEFKTQALCAVSGPVDNDNGIQEKIAFACIVPTISKTDNSSTAVLNLANSDISKVIFTLHKASDNSIVTGPLTITRSGTGASATANSLESATSYFWETKLVAVVAGAEVTSASCVSANFTTDSGVCQPMTSITATATEY